MINPKTMGENKTKVATPPTLKMPLGGERDPGLEWR